MMYRLLCEIYGDDNVITVDTLNYKKRPFSIIKRFISSVFTCNDMVVLLSENGRKTFFPILYFLAKHHNLKVYHNLIGGWLASNLEKYPQWIKYLNSFEINWVESHQLVNSLADKGVSNAFYLPNFKYYDNRISNVSFSHTAQLRFCTFSRVVNQKGIGDAMQAIETLNARKIRCSLDIFGPIDDTYKNEFKRKLASSPHSTYAGCIPPESSILSIAKYHALLFPTKWSLEGIPGTIIDALTAGVPIIASKWQYYDEMLEDGITGFGYDIEQPNLLVSAIEKFISQNENEIKQMHSNCLERAKSYTPKAVMPIIKRELG